MRSRVARFAASVAMAALLASPAPARVFRAADDQGEDFVTVRALDLFGRAVSEQTAGRHRVVVFHSRQLGEDRDTIEQTRAGAIDLARVSAVLLARYVPVADVLSLPYLFRSDAHMQAVLDGPVGRDLLAGFRGAGFEALAFLPAGPRILYTTARAVRTASDLAGLRIRVQDSPLSAEIASALGALPVTLGSGQVAAALRLGLVDGAENTWDGYVASGHNLLARFVVETAQTMPPDVLLMSQREWDSLDPPDRSAIREAARRAVAFVRAERTELARTARAGATATGTVIAVDPDGATFARVVRPVRDRALTDPALRDLADRIAADPTP